MMTLNNHLPASSQHFASLGKPVQVCEEDSSLIGDSRPANNFCQLSLWASSFLAQFSRSARNRHDSPIGNGHKSKTKELTMNYYTTNYVKWSRPTASSSYWCAAKRRGNYSLCGWVNWTRFVVRVLRNLTFQNHTADLQNFSFLNYAFIYRESNALT